MGLNDHNQTLNDMKRVLYQAPESELIEVGFEGNILSNVEGVTIISGDDAGEWDEDE